ncbi:MAG: MoxR family ATPase, partial [Deltaproteobacteria bacterium]|nr:MoxR family ATPase [Deltaproteobacteria bacterium]
TTEESISTRKINAISQSINESIIFVSKKVIGRRDMIKQAFLALMTGEHQLLISRTGMAKSLLARQIFACFDNAQLFEKQLTKDTMPENLFGAYDIEAMKKGKMIHNVEGSLVLSHFAFLDEIFDANDMLLRSLLSVLNEKQLVNGEQIVYSTLHSAIAAANYIRVTDVLEAVIDRFLYKCFIPENKETYFQYSIDQIYQENFGKVTIPEKRLTLGELSFVKNLIQSQQIKIPGYVLFLKNYILRKYIEETRNTVSDRKDWTISDRKSVKTQDTLRAAAILDGRLEVDESDIDSLYYAVCVLGRDDEKTRLQKIISAAKNYFRQDRKVLENIFNAISIFNIIKTSESLEDLKTDDAFTRIRTGLERVTKAEGSILRDYFNKLKQTIMNLSRDAFIPETINVLEKLCELSLKDIKTREGRELITGMQADLFNAKKILQL